MSEPASIADLQGDLPCDRQPDTMANTTSASESEIRIRKSTLKESEKIQILLDALDHMAKLAALDSETYGRTLASSCPLSETDAHKNAGSIQKMLDRLQNQWKIEETPIPRLVDSIHRLHSTCIQLESHSDELIHENEKLHDALSSSSKRVNKLEAALKKIHSSNQSLKLKLQAKKSEKQSILSNMKNYMRDFQKHDFEGIATQLQAHERILGNRVRTESHDTFDSIDVAALHQLGSDELYRDYSDKESSNDDLSILSGSASSVPSFITDEGLAVVKFAASPAEEEEEEHDIHLHYPAGHIVGLQFHHVYLPSNRGLVESSLIGHSPDEDSGNSKASPFKNFHFKLPDQFRASRKTSSAYLVCGHHGFDDTLNSQRPPIGAQLMKVNGMVLNDGDTLSKIQEAIKENSFTLSFRVIPLTVKQRNLVDKISIETAQSTVRSRTGSFDLDNSVQHECSDDGFKLQDTLGSRSRDLSPQRSLTNQIFNGKPNSDKNIELIHATDEVHHPTDKLRKHIQDVGMHFKAFF